jgi:hypothetical protein
MKIWRSSRSVNSNIFIWNRDEIVLVWFTHIWCNKHLILYFTLKKLRVEQCTEMTIKIITALLTKRINYIKVYRNAAVWKQITKTNNHSVPSRTSYSIRQPAPPHVSIAIGLLSSRNHTHIFTNSHRNNLTKILWIYVPSCIHFVIAFKYS